MNLYFIKTKGNGSIILKFGVIKYSAIDKYELNDLLNRRVKTYCLSFKKYTTNKNT